MPFKQETRLSQPQIDFIMNMKNVKYSKLEIARKLGVTEGAVRYQIKRQASGLSDGRKIKDSMLDRYEEILFYWTSEYEGEEGRPSLKILYENLRKYHGYAGSYDAFRRYIRKRFPEFLKKRSYIRVETPPGALVQVDWKEGIAVYIGSLETPVKLNALVISLCFSRKMAVIFSEKKDLDSFIACHQRGFLKLGGLAETERTDCLKSAVVRWNGSQTILNEKYRKYLSELGVEAFPSRPGTPTDKGKVEKRIGDFFCRLDLKHKVYQTLEDLDREADAKLEELEKEWRCGATGLSVSQSFEYEKVYLKMLPSHFPVLPVAKQRGRAYVKNALVLVDELGYQALDRHETHLFFQFISARYMKGSTIITSNRSVREWSDIFSQDEMATTAILDRLFHKSVIFNIDGRSYRLRDFNKLFRETSR